MTNSGLDLQQTGIASRSHISPAINPFNNYQTSFRFESHADGNVEALRKILKRLTKTYLPGKEYIEAYLRHVTRQARCHPDKSCRSIDGTGIVYPNRLF